MLYLVYLFIIFALVSIDQLTKSLIVSYIKLNDSIEIIKNFFYIHYVQNFGAGFSIMQNQTIFFYILTPICIGLFIYFLIKTDRNNKLQRISFLLMLAGTIGNFIDRIINVFVIDFLDFYIFGYDFPVFNMADIFLTIGCFLLIFSSIMESKNAKN